MDAFDPVRAKAYASFYAREEWHNHVQMSCDGGLRRKGNDATLLFWRAWAMSMQGAHNEAIAELEGLRRKRDVDYAVLVALTAAHNKCKVVDYGALDALQTEMGSTERGATEAARLLAAQFLLHSGELNECVRLLEGGLLPRRGTDDSEKTPLQQRAETARGWAHLRSAAQSRGGRGGGFVEELDAALEQLGGSGGGGGGVAAQNDPDVLLGRARVFERRGQRGAALEELTRAVVTFPWFAPALCEKARLLMCAGDWEQGLETVRRALALDGGSVAALRLEACHALCHGSDVDGTARLLGRLVAALDAGEPRCAALFHACAVPFARLARDDYSLLQQTLALAERAAAADPSSAVYAAEVGLQQLMLGEVREATAAFRRASKLDESSVQALHGLVRCQLFGGGANAAADAKAPSSADFADAAQQLEFLGVIQDGGDDETKAEFTFLQAALAWRKDGDMARALALLRQAARLQADRAADAAKAAAAAESLSGPYGASDPALMLGAADPHFVMELVREHMQHLGGEPLEAAALAHGEAAGDCLRAALRLLRGLLQTMPAHREAALALATAHYVGGDAPAAGRLCADMLARDPGHAAVHLLRARIALQHDGRRHAAEQALEQAVAEDFGIRNTIMFHLLKARVLKGGNRVAAALEVLQAGLAIPGVRRKRKSSTAADGGRRGSAGSAASAAVAVLPNERCALFLDAAELHAALNNSQDAIKLIAEAKHIFRARPAESGLIAIAEAAVASRHGKHRMAIATLSSVPSSSAAAPAAARAKAEVYLLHRRDPRAFIRCFEELTEESASGGHGGHDDAPPRGPGARAAAFVSLGDAHLRIQQPEKAIGAYQAALQLSQAGGVNKGAGGGASGAATLAAKIGRVMTSMHDFEAAIRYYEQSLRGLPPAPSSMAGSGDGDEAAGAARAALQQQLAGLYNKLGLHDEAGRVLGEALEHIIGPDAEGMGDDEDGMGGMGGMGGGMGRIGGGRSSSSSSRGRRSNRPIAQMRTDTHNLLLLADVRASRVRAAFDPDGMGEPEALAAEQEEGQALSLARSLAERALQQLSSSDHHGGGGGGRGGHGGGGGGGGGRSADSADASEVAEQRALVARVLARTAEFELRSIGGAADEAPVDPMEAPLGVQQRKAAPGAAGPEFRGAGGGAEGAGGERAAGLYGAALRASAGNVPIMLALARLQLTRGDLEGCQHQCVAILRIENEEDVHHGMGLSGGGGGGAHSIIEAALASNDEESGGGGHGGGHGGGGHGGNDEATLILADVMWRRGDTDTALFHFRRLLERSAVAFEALSRLVLLLRFLGKLDDAKPLLEEAERAAHTCSEMAGLRHCQGLFHRYSNDVHEAIRCLNLASRDATWGERSLTHMIEIYINPANENLWEAAAEHDAGGGNDSARAEAVRVADDLLRKLPAMAPRGRSGGGGGGGSPNRGAFSPGSPATEAGGSMAPGGGALSSARAKRRAVLEAYVLLATGIKHNVERALKRCVELLGVQNDYVPALLAMATGFMIQKQLPKARNQLKRISKMAYDLDFADEFERGYLMLVELYIEKGKFDIAQDLCKKALRCNASSAKAQEYLGLIMEKEQSYRDAADHYYKAWHFDGEASAAAGYKLAFQYLKAERYVEAVDVCHKVIKMYPDYPRIREDILDKARASLRA